MESWILISFFMSYITSFSCDEFNIIRFRRRDSKNITLAETPLICITDNINDAIIWNDIIDQNITEFSSGNANNSSTRAELYSAGTVINDRRICGPDDRSHNCKFLFDAKNSDWKSTWHTDMPMGPVFDSRWEEFYELRTIGLLPYQPVQVIRSGVIHNVTIDGSGTLVVSIRGAGDARILMCAHPDSTIGLCYWIVIGGMENSQSLIKKCWSRTGKPPPTYECARVESVLRHHPLNVTEWRTFVINWNGLTKNMKIYNPDMEILNYSDDSVESNNISTLHVFFGSTDHPVRFRFHEYEYGLTRQPDTQYNTHYYKMNSSYFICIDMMVGLCATCELHVRLVGSTETKQRAKEIISRSAASKNVQHGLPMWQHTRITASSIDGPIKFARLEITTKSTHPRSSHHWAIGDVQQCLPGGTIKRRTTRVSQETRDAVEYWQKITCQRLSYDPQRAEVIDAAWMATNPPEHVTVCPAHRIGPKCGTSCNEFFYSKCSGVAICKKSYCYCSPGFDAIDDCFSSCSSRDKQFKYDCENRCGTCKDRICTNTRRCTRGCEEIEGEYRYVPPFCTGSVKFEKLQFKQIDMETLRVYFPKVDYGKQYQITNEVKLQENNNKWQKRNINSTIDSEKGPMYFVDFDKLNPGTQYKARITLHIKNEPTELLREVHLDGDLSAPVTLCIWTSNFTIGRDDTTLTIDKVDVEKYSCSDDWYSVEVLQPTSDVNKTQTIHATVVRGKFPMTVGNLIPDTSYEISITGKSSSFQFRQEVRTLPEHARVLAGGPSAVRDLKIDSVSSTEVSFSWLPLGKPNGIIHGYTVTLKALHHVSCVNDVTLNYRTQSFNVTSTSTSYRISDLIPYVYYNLTILVNNAKKGEPSSINFTTKAREIPTAVYETLEFENDRIKWSENGIPCQTISGPILATRLFFFGVGANVKDFTDQYDTMGRSFTLDAIRILGIRGCERYRVRIHVLRELNGIHNESAYNEIIFTTNPRSPDPPGRVSISNIENGTVYLNWKSPPETAGPVRQFIIRCLLISSQLRKFVRLDDTEKHYDIRTINHQELYNTQLDLLPSSHYNVYIYGAMQCGNNSAMGHPATIGIYTPSFFAWHKEEPIIVNDETSRSLKLVIPKIVHETKNSIVHVLTIGNTFCRTPPVFWENLSWDIHLKKDEIPWHVGAWRIAPQSVILGFYGNSSHNIICPLVEGTSYIFVILVRDEDIAKIKWSKSLVWRSNPRYFGRVLDLSYNHRYEVWAAPLVFLLIIGLIGIVCYLVIRKKNNQTDTENISTVNGPVSSRGVPHPTATESLESLRPRRAVTHHELYLIPIKEHVYEEIEERTLVKLNEFQDYVKDTIASGELKRQYSYLSPGQMKSWEDGLLSEHATGDECDIGIARDETAVVLEEHPDDPYFECINAHYINGYKRDRAYIVLQGPQPAAVTTFWRMVWQEQVEVICMISDIVNEEQMNCDLYWPEVYKCKDYGNISVDNVSTRPFADYTFRVLRVKCGGKIRMINHLHYTAWPDYGIPLYTQSIVTYLKKLSTIPLSDGPVIFHCNAAVGRTGTMILLDICYRRAITEGVVDVFVESERIRKQRADMVNDKQQYIFIHVALVEWFLSSPTAMTCDNSLLMKIEKHKNQSSLQRKRVEQSVLQDKALQLSAPSRLELSAKNIAKNRFTNSLPMTRLYIPRYPTSDDDSSYISGVYADSARRRNSYVASQLPLPTTVNDFWRMIAAFKVELIIILQRPDIADPTCCNFLPEPDEEIEILSFLRINGKLIIDGEHFIQQKIILTDNFAGSSRKQTVTILTCKGWDSGRHKPPPTPATLVNLWRTAERISRCEEPTVVLCHDGVTGCGLFLALSFLLERMGLERECDICFAIRAIKRSRLNFCETQD